MAIPSFPMGMTDNHRPGDFPRSAALDVLQEPVAPAGPLAGALAAPAAAPALAAFLAEALRAEDRVGQVLDVLSGHRPVLRAAVPRIPQAAGALPRLPAGVLPGQGCRTYAGTGGRCTRSPRRTGCTVPSAATTGRYQLRHRSRAARPDPRRLRRAARPAYLIRKRSGQAGDRSA